METDHIIDLAILEGDEGDQEKKNFYTKKHKLKKDIAEICGDIFELHDKVLKKYKIDFFDLVVTEKMVKYHLKEDGIAPSVFKAWDEKKQKEYTAKITPKSQTILEINQKILKTFRQQGEYWLYGLEY